MRRIFSAFAYGPGPRDGCWWDETCPAPDWPVLDGDLRADVAVVGGGFTGVSAALHLAEAGLSVVVLEACAPGFGASGRNGGFCCLGGGMASDAALDRRHGPGAAAEFRAAERAAVALVVALLDRHGIAVDRHSRGETQLAHRPRDMAKLRREAKRVPGSVLIEDPAAAGMGGPFHGALTVPDGLALNPRKYLFGLARVAAQSGMRAFQKSPVTRISPGQVETARGTVRAEAILVATNGYSSEDVPPWLAGRYVPAQSSVLVTRPLSDTELDAQGWTSDQMCYDTRGLLHYFRLMPDRRFLFGMRGGLTSTAHGEARTRARTERHFRAMFPAWRAVPITHRWSGMVCLSRYGTPYIGPVPGLPGVHAGLSYHGNGVAMATYAGRALAGCVLGRAEVARAMAALPGRFPLGRWRRALMPPFYLMRALRDL